MSNAADLELSEDLEAEFNPHVAIVANDLERFAKFAQLFEKNGFPCKLFNAAPEDLMIGTRAGTVFFVSFNLKATEPVALAKVIRNHLKMSCIVFAELEGTETAAKLSSAKLPQTLQHPYTEKNFLMAVQTLVKMRKLQKERTQKKNEVRERRKGSGDGDAADSADDKKIFKTEKAKIDTNSPIHVKSAGTPAKGPKLAIVKGDASKAAEVITQSQPKGTAFQVKQEGAALDAAVVVKGTAPLSAGGTAGPAAERKPEFKLKGEAADAATSAAASTSVQAAAVRSGAQAVALKAAVAADHKDRAANAVNDMSVKASSVVASARARASATDTTTVSASDAATPTTLATDAATATAPAPAPAPESARNSAPASLPNQITLIANFALPTRLLLWGCGLGILLCLAALYLIIAR